MSEPVFLRGADLVLPDQVAGGLGVLVSGGRIEALLPAADPPRGVRVEEMDGGTLWPGFIDVQVNGGGGVLLNDAPTLDGIAAIAEAHRRFGTAGLLPTLISDDLSVVKAAIGAVQAALDAGVPGVLGIHLEGPFLSAARKGVHPAEKFRRLDADAIALLSSLRGGVTMVTLAPETAPPGAIKALTGAGVRVMAGHTDATWEQMQAAFAEGLVGATHLFNAMSPLTARAPGVTGAILENASAAAGIIVDGAHVHDAALRLAAKAMGPGRLMLVTDAMPTVGSASNTFELFGQTIVARGETCWTPEGALAGSNLTTAGGVRNAMTRMSSSTVDTARMAATTPARLLGLAGQTGAIAPGLRADLTHLDAAGYARKVWIGGA